MNRNIDVMAEMRKLGESKPVHAVAGAGALASQMLRELPWRLVQWTRDNPPHSLPTRASGYVQTAQSRANEAVQTAQSRANEAVQTAQSRANEAARTARARAAGGYDALAARGKKAMNGHAIAAKSTPAKSTPAKSAPAKSAPATASKAALNGKPKGKAPSSRSTTSH